jgi:drug/metabolite transporter (DMT)-like permease
MRSRRSPAAFLILLGFFGILIVTRNPRFASFHSVDVLQLVASGACFGIGITLLFASRNRQSS